MNEGLRTIIYPVKDVAKAKKIYGALLGANPDVDEPYYVGFTAGDQHLGLDPNGYSQGVTGPIGYWHVDDINKSLEVLLAAGAQIQQEVKDVGGGKLVATVRDTDGNVTGLIQDS